jgi:glutathione S-transferase
MVILRYLDEVLDGPPVRREDPYEHGLESLIVAKEGDYGAAGYLFVMNRDRGKRDAFRDKLLKQCRDLDKLLRDYAPGDTFVFDAFGWAEAVFTPLMQRFWFLDYYEDFEVPDDPDLARFKRWHDACRAHESARQTSKEEIVKVYYDYAQGQGNGSLPEGREVSTFTFTPDWRDRPMPPRDKWNPVGDAELGLV